MFASIFILFFMSSCDYHTETKINIENESSYDLHIAFGADYHQSQYKEIEVKKNEAFSFIIEGFGAAAAPNSNSDVKKIIFSNLETGEVIKEVNNNKLFELTWCKGRNWVGLPAHEAHYLLKITDELLSQN